MKKAFLSLLAVLACITVSTQAQNIFGHLKDIRGKGGDPEAVSKLRAAENYIYENYVDAVDLDSLTEEAIRAMLRTLDPHSTYSTAEETRALEEPLQGNFSGIGITFNINNDTLLVISTIAGGPAERAGMLPGDRITMVDDTVIAGVKMSRNDIMKRIRGPRGSDVSIVVDRRSTPGKPLTFVITREDIPIYSVEATYMLDKENGYIRLTRFAEDTPREIANAIAKLKKQGMKNLIIDLQSNGGGYLVAATDLAEMFLKRGDKIMFTQSSRSLPRYYVATETGEMIDGRVVILVNQYSASASEILSGALQDNDRAVIVGRRTFGKGLVQRPFRFSDGSMMRLTIARYYTPSGRCIQKPYTSGDDEDYSHDMASRYASGEFTSADSVHFDESQLFYTRGGRPVYGGGGIMPDRFVPIDTTAFTDYYSALLRKGVLKDYTLHYYDHNVNSLKKKFKTEADYLKKFTVTEEMLADLIAMGEKEEIEFNQEQWDLSRDYIADYIRATIGSDLFGYDTFYKIMNRWDPIFTAGYEIITSPQAYDELLRIPK